MQSELLPIKRRVVGIERKDGTIGPGRTEILGRASKRSRGGVESCLLTSPVPGVGIDALSLLVGAWADHWF